MGLRDRDAGTVGFTTSLGFGRKLQRIDANPRVALAYHTRAHGFAQAPRFVLVQGEASYEAHPDRELLEQELMPASERFMGPPKRGVFWDRWLSAYYADRVVVTVRVERVVSWDDLACSGRPTVVGAPLAEDDPPSQEAPRNGIAPRVDVQKAARRLRALPDVLLGYRGADGFPVIEPVEVGETRPNGISLEGPIPGGARRAGLMGHRYEAQLIGLETRQYTGWLEDGIYAPHTSSGFTAPANKTVLLLANGFLARRGLRQAQRAGRA